MGVRFDDRVTGKLETFAPDARFVHVDVDPAEISKNVTVDVPIVGDAKKVLAALLVELKKLDLSPDRHLPWMEQVEAWKRDHPLVIREPEDGQIMPEAAVHKIWEVTHGEAVVCTEVGQHQMWAAQYYLARHPRRFISSGGLGTMGFGFPAAIGAQVACPDALVVDIAGDGSFQMTLQELATAVQYGLPVKVCIINNQYLGMVRQWQELFWQGRYSPTCMECQPDFVKLAEAYGAVGLRATRPDELEEVLRVGLAADGPAVIDIRVKTGGERLSHDPRRGHGRRHDPLEGGPMKHTLSVLVENKPGVLTRVAGLFARRGFNIDSLVVAETENPAVSRMTITVDEQDQPVEQVTKQLHKLINVLKIVDLDPGASVERELLLVKVKADAEARSEIMQMVEIFRAKIVDVSREVLIVEMTGTRDKVSAFVELLAPFGVVELMRTGHVAISRGKRPT